MNKKISLGVTISLIAVACAITFVLTMTVSLNMYNSMVAGIREREAIDAKIKEVDTFVRSFSIYTVNEDELIHGIMHGYISGLDDAYAQYYTAPEYYKQQQIESGVIIGVGVETQISGDYLEVIKVYEGSSADVAGIRKGDMITGINSKNMLDIGAASAQKMLDGEEGTRITLTVKQPDDEDPKNFTVIRQQIKLKSVESALINGYAYIKITTFNNTTNEQFVQAIDNYEAQSVLGYIFDVRDVSDGVITPLKAMLNRVLPKAVTAYAKSADGTEQILVETDGESAINKPITVLANIGTSCIAEIFAAAMRDYCNAALIGVTTAGKGEMQTTQSFKDGSAVSVSSAWIYPSESENFDDVGLKPDYTVELTAQQIEDIVFADPESDPQLQKALEIIVTK